MAETIITQDNISVSPETSTMTIQFKPDPVGRPSESGRNMVVASTGGFIQVGELRVSVNVIKRRK